MTIGRQPNCVTGVWSYFFLYETEIQITPIVVEADIGQDEINKILLLILLLKMK